MDGQRIERAELTNMALYWDQKTVVLPIICLWITSYYAAKAEPINATEESTAKIFWNGQKWAHRCIFHVNETQILDIYTLSHWDSDVCGQACASDGNCTAYAWAPSTPNTEEPFECTLLSGNISETDAKSSLSSARMCGLKDASVLKLVPWNGRNWAEGCVFIKGEFRNSRPGTATREECSRLCSEQADCSGYHWRPAQLCGLVLTESPLVKADALMPSEKNYPRGSILCGLRGS
ncbi:hypothetical protein BV898_01180 [Hypsibius exemplaris]|uniref:Apple domain-containing protein n=1 Tax=Hypsibius exemplaris TaxID=2072580 RepID=A0A1W0XCI5_HYPEX|nr:hypothetical protein BV898_01180 [Hypsibius exemplaris]